MCVPTPEGINNYSHEMNHNNQLNKFFSVSMYGIGIGIGVALVTKSKEEKGDIVLTIHFIVGGISTVVH